MNKIKVFGKDIEDIGLLFLCILSSLFLLLYDPYEFVLPFAPKAPVLYIAAISFLFLMYIKCSMQKEEVVKVKANIPIVIYAILIVISSFLSKYQDLVYFGHIQRLEGAFALLSYIIVYFAALHLIKTNKIFVLLYTLLTTCSIVAGIGMLEFYGMNPLPQAFKVIRVGLNYKVTIYSTIGNQNFIGSLMCLTLLISIVLYIVENNKRKRIFFFLCCTFLYGGIIVTNTRSGWLGTMFGIIVLFFILIKNNMIKKIWKSACLLFVVFFIVGISISMTSEGRIGGKLINSFHQVKNVVRGSEAVDRLGTSRIYIWENTLPLLKDYYLFGSGPDTLSRTFPYDPEESREHFGDPNMMVDKAHNDYLQISVTTGIFSLFAYLTFICMILYQNVKIIFKLNLSNKYEPIIAATFIGCMGYMVQSFFNISVVAVAPIYWMVLGINQNFAYKYTKNTLYEEEILEENEEILEENLNNSTETLSM